MVYNPLMLQKNKKTSIWPRERFVGKGYLLAFVICIAIATAFTFFLQNYTKQLLRERLNERLIGIVSTASLQFSGDEIEHIKQLGLKAGSTDFYRANVLKLQAIRQANKNIRYAYIIAKTDDPTKVEYVVDADAMVLTPTIDFNEDGVVNNEDISRPGDIYDASDVPAMQGPAFIEPSIDLVLSTDTWGTFLSAYAPIFDKNGKVTGSLTIDVNVSDFIALVNTTFIPFLLFIIALLLLISLLTIYIIRIWNNRVEVVKELDRQKDELLGIVSHQLATPVSSVKFYLEMMLDGDLGKISAQQKEHLRSLQSVTADLSDLVSLILDVSRIQLGKMKVEKSKLDLNEFFKEILDIIEPKAKEKGTHFNVSVQEKLPEAMLDKRYTHMTIENLLSNAIKYTPKEGKVNFKVEVRGETLYCEVSDTGVGIPKADQAQIFGKLFRASNVRNEVDGNGFGLYVAKGAVEAQGGKIWFKSEEGKGTTFFVELPLK